MIPDADLARAKGVPIAEVIGAEVALRPKGRELAGLCPFHNEKTPSFYVAPDKGFWHCFGCGAHGDVIGFVMRRCGLDFVEAVRWLLDLPSDVSPQRKQVATTRPRETDAQTAARVQAIIRECVPATRGTVAAFYLWSRGLGDHHPALLSHPALYCSEIGKPLPALVAPITASDGRVTAVQRIWCLSIEDYERDPAGWARNHQSMFSGEALASIRSLARSARDARPKLDTRKKTLGAMLDGAVRLAPAGATLGLAEGVESAIAASRLFRVPVWSVCGAARLGRVWIPPEVRMVWIFGDRGASGEDLAERAVEAWHRRGLVAEAMFPSDGFGDFNDQLLGKRSA